MNTAQDTQRAIAEEVRLIHKEMSWVVKHLARVYAMIKPPAVEGETADPMQLSMFED